MSDFAERDIRRLRERCEAAENMSQADADVLLEFSDRLRLLGDAQYSPERHEFHLMRLVNMATEVGGVADALTDRSAAERIVSWIHDEYDNAETNHDYRTALRMFGEHMHDGDGKPESIEWVPGGYPSTHDRMPDPARMYRWEQHIQPMLDAAINVRDSALVAVAWDVGPRSGELHSLRVGDVTDHEIGLQVRLDGKRGQRAVTAIPSVPYLQQWLTAHPRGDDPTAPLWCKLDSGGEITPTMMRKALREVADRADMTPPSKPTPTRMRKSSASYLASEGVNQPVLEDHHGWKRGSDVAARYVAVFGEAADRELARAHGMDVGDAPAEPAATAPVVCPRCDRETPRDKPACTWCGQALTHDGAAALASQEDAIAQGLASLDGDEAEALLQLRDTLQSNPALRAALDDFSDH